METETSPPIQDQPQQGPQEPLTTKAGEEASRLLQDLLESVRRSARKSVSVFVASPYGLQGVGVVGGDTEEVLVMEIPVATVEFPEDVAKAVDTIRFFLDDRLTAERVRMRRLLS